VLAQGGRKKECHGVLTLLIPGLSGQLFPPKTKIPVSFPGKVMAAFRPLPWCHGLWAGTERMRFILQDCNVLFI
jgi:hypothetical protein